jgi:heme oxygenase
MLNETTTVMDVLKESTRELHTAAERHPVEQALLAGTLPRETYVLYLAQMLCVHRALESHLREHECEAPFSAVLHEHQYQVPYLVEDLRFFGVDPDSVGASPGTGRLVDEIRETAARHPVALLGYHYVLEGSNNGSRFIARAVRAAYRLDQDGTRYLDPYGDKQSEYWQSFRQAMVSVDFGENDIGHIVATAKGMFAGLVSVFDDVSAAQPPRRCG